jgi:hypothetical protein
MKSSISTFFSYVFMVSAFVSVVSALCLIVVLLRYFGGAASETELEIARYFSIVLITSVTLSPLSLYVSDKLGKFSGQREKV